MLLTKHITINMLTDSFVEKQKPKLFLHICPQKTTTLLVVAICLFISIHFFLLRRRCVVFWYRKK